jgi:hypothetical protein
MSLLSLLEPNRFEVITIVKKYLITIACVLILLLQGGFDDSIWSLAGIVTSVFLIFKAKRRPLTPIVILLLSMILIYCMAMFYHGLTFEALASVNRVIVVFLILMVFINIETDTDDTILILGLVAAGIGLVAFSGIITWDGAVSARRLQSTFQYANAAGLFFAVSAFVAHQSEKRKPYAFILETAMLLTQSVGAIIVYVFGWIAYAFINRNKAIISRSKINYFVCSLILALISASLVFGLVYVIGTPQLGILPPILMFALWKKYQHYFIKITQKKFVLWTGIGAIPIMGAVLIFTRGLRPVATYIERIIQSIDGINIMLRYPFGLGPGSWQFYFTEYQSAPYEVSKIHNEYVAMGVDAGFLIIIPVLALLVYWFKRQNWDYRSISIIMILIHAAMDIPFSFLIVVIILVMLATNETMPTKPMPSYARFTFIIPIMLCALIFSSTAIRNRAAWLANAGDFESAISMLDNRLIQNDTDTILTQMSLFSLMGDHENVERVHLTLHRRNARAYFMLASSYLDRQLPNGAIAYAVAGIELAPHSPQGLSLAEQIIPYLSSDKQLVYREKIEIYMEGVHVIPLFIYIKKILEGG